MFKFFKIALVFFLIVSLAAPAEARRHRRVRTPVTGFSAQSALLWNITDDKIIFSKDADKRIFAASTTKVMTVMLALEKLPLDQYVTVSQRATQVPPTKLDFHPGEQYKVSDLIFACLLKSANDAAGVLAEAVAGSEEKFVDMMNAKALAIGAKDTHFANPHGLPSAAQQYTTAHDMALMFKEALKDPFFQKATTFPYRIIYSKGGRRHFLKSHNKAFFMNWKHSIYGKTGYTLQAQSCFVGYFQKGSQTFIVDVFGCRTRKRWEDIKWLVEHYAGVDL